MPASMNEKSSSPERHSRHSRSHMKASTPIEIPIRRKSSMNALGNHPHSHDMVFEMSPVSPTFSPASSMYPSTSQSRLNEMKTHERFMYHVPIIRISPNGAASQLRRKITRQNDTLSRNDSSITLAGAELPDLTNGESSTAEITHALIPQQDHLRRKKTRSTTKITGFMPINEPQPPICEKPSRPTIPLHPPPRTPSYQLSSRAPPAKCDDDVSYSQADPSLFEFQRHLLRRIENQDPSRFKNPYSQCL